MVTTRHIIYQLGHEVVLLWRQLPLLFDTMTSFAMPRTEGPDSVELSHNHILNRQAYLDFITSGESMLLPST
jgi:hypothetical protein